MRRAQCVGPYVQEEADSGEKAIYISATQILAEMSKKGVRM
jgi:hypothetical protein